MKTIGLCFIALFAGGIAVPIFGVDKNIENRIIGGNETNIEEHPYQMSLMHFGGHICGGAIITDYVALTAAHCLRYPEDPLEYNIMAGATSIYEDDKEQLRQVIRLLRHPRYHRYPTTNDVGLVYWEHPLVFGANLRPVGLPLQNESVPYGHDANVTGWGIIREGKQEPISEILRVATLPLISNDECQKIFGDVITDVMLCAGVAEGGRDACNGDSGGPLVVDGVQLGVVSFGRGCARPNIPGVYARVASFVDWIHENIE